MDIEYAVLKLSFSTISPSRTGGGEGFHIRFSCKRSKRYVEFGILRVITYINEPHIIIIFLFS